MNDEYWMQEALELARQAEQLGEVPVGALVVHEGERLGAGFNQPLSSHDPTAHAEIMALRAAAANMQNYRLPGTTLYVTIEPCTMCLGAMIHARVGRLVFGAREPRAGAVCSHFRLLESEVYNHRMEWTGGVLAEDSAALLQTFFRRRR